MPDNWDWSKPEIMSGDLASINGCYWTELQTGSCLSGLFIACSVVRPNSLFLVKILGSSGTSIVFNFGAG